MSAPQVEGSVRTFGYEDTLRWRRYFGAANHPELPQDLYDVEVGPDGHVQLRDRTLYMPVGLYVAVDYFDRVLYIGQVSRNSGTGIVERVQNHHAIPPTSVGVWILPLRDDLSPMTVSRFEETIITAYQPPANCQHCQRGRETARMPKYAVAS